MFINKIKESLFSNKPTGIYYGVLVYKAINHEGREIIFEPTNLPIFDNEMDAVDYFANTACFHSEIIEGPKDELAKKFVERKAYLRKDDFSNLLKEIEACN